MEINGNRTPKSSDSFGSLLNRSEWLLVFASGCGAALLKLLFATRRGFWLDEYYTLQAASLPLPELIADRLAAGHSPLPFFYARVFHEVLGNSELALRSSSALAAFAVVFGCAGLLAQLRLRHALAPLLLMAPFVPFWQEIGNEFRYTMPLVAVGSFWAWALVRWWQSRSWGSAAATMLLGALALWTHGSAQFIALAFVAFPFVAA